jgi:hypothetical protein
MPAGSDPVVSLPRIFRPFGVRIAVYLFAAVLSGTVLVIWLAFAPEVRAQFSVFQRATVILFGVAAAACGYALARCRVEARRDSMIVVNGYKTRRYDWNEVLSITLPTGSPWATLDLSDGTSIPAMGIQGSDGARAVTALREIRSLLQQQSRTERDD